MSINGYINVCFKNSVGHRDVTPYRSCRDNAYSMDFRSKKQMACFVANVIRQINSVGNDTGVIPYYVI